METFVLIERIKVQFNPSGKEVEVIDKIIRTYLSRSRATDDMDLLREAAPDRRFDIIEVQHIDN